MKKPLLDLYTDCLTSAFGQTTATAPSRLPGEEIGQDHVTRFLASPAKTGVDLLRVVKPLARQIESRDGVLIPKESIEENPRILTIMNWSAGVGITPKSSPPMGSIF